MLSLLKSRRAWVVGIVVGLGLVVLWFFIRADDFSKIQVGMTDEEVVAILGEPGNKTGPTEAEWEGTVIANTDPQKKHWKLWLVREGYITIWFDRDLRVSSKEIVPVPFLEKMRGWLGL